MCILFWTVDNHSKYRFIFAGNRDEFLGRPTSSAHIWEQQYKRLSTGESYKVIGGTDLEFKEGKEDVNDSSTTAKTNGTWLGITTDGRFSALTNYREFPNNKKDNNKSRGCLVRDYLIGDVTVNEYLKQRQLDADQYSGYNLLWMHFKPREQQQKRDDDEMIYFTNRDKDQPFTQLKKKEIYGLSNSILVNPWKKVEQGKAIFEKIIKKEGLNEEQLINELFGLLRTTEPFTNPSDIYQSLEESKERIYFPLMNEQDKKLSYGTRTSTIILIDEKDNVTFIEKDWYDLMNDRFIEKEKPESRCFKFHLNDVNNAIINK
ncbi:NRDE protein-domain-containing protein [Cunninghamella echinulata]|nr:NRDE protein-domain-containing protein [Cunninghamella echinulata]